MISWLYPQYDELFNVWFNSTADFFSQRMLKQKVTKLNAFFLNNVYFFLVGQLFFVQSVAENCAFQVYTNGCAIICRNCNRASREKLNKICIKIKNNRFIRSILSIILYNFSADRPIKNVALNYGTSSFMVFSWYWIQGYAEWRASWMASAVSGLSIRNCLAASRPWPRRMSCQLNQAPLFLTIPASTPMSRISLSRLMPRP